MPSHALPERPSLEYLKKLAKERLRELQRTYPTAKLADAQLAIARENGFPSWRALKAEVDRRVASPVEAFFAASSVGDLETMRSLLTQDSGLARARHRGTTALHQAVRHAEAVKLLLEHGADPDAREEGDNATPLHFAAGGGTLESVRLLLDAGADPQGEGDLHQMDVIGWATIVDQARREVVELLVAYGARHNIFSAIAMGDPALVRAVVQADPHALARRLSRFEQHQTALHYVVAPADGLVGGRFRTGEHYRTLEALLELGADLEAKDDKGRTPMAMAMLRGDMEAMRLLHAAGAKDPEPTDLAAANEPPSALAGSMGRVTPMLGAHDIDETIAWYQAVGFELAESHAEEGRIDWAMMKFGGAEIMLVPGGDLRRVETRWLSLWIQTSQLDELYARLKQKQLERARADLAGRPAEVPELKFTADLYTAFYGQREFGLRDPNGVELMFAQPVA